MSERYNRIRLLGKGSFANAWLVVDSETQRQLVMKEMRTFAKVWPSFSMSNRALIIMCL